MINFASKIYFKIERLEYQTKLMAKFVLSQFKTKSVDEATHFEMTGKEGGKFKIPLDKRKNLYKFIEENPEYTITERPKKIFPLYFDIDDLDEKENNLEDLIDTIMIPNIKKVLDISDDTLFFYSTLRNKSKPNYYHIHFPRIFVSSITARKISRLINKEKNILDLSVYKNGLRIFKTLKPTKNKPKKRDKNSYYEFLNTKLNKKPIEKVIKYVSIQVPEDTEATPLNEDFQNIEVEEEKEEKEESKEIDVKKLSQYCNELTRLKAKWTYTVGEGDYSGSYFLKTVDDGTCLAYLLKEGKRHIHEHKGHSSIQIAKNLATVRCFNEQGHGKHSLKGMKELKPTLSKIKKLLGLIKNENDLNDYEQLCELMIKYAADRKYKRNGGYVMKPHDKIPIVYQRHCLYSDFLNEVFTKTTNDYYYRLYRKSPRNHKSLLTYLETYEDRYFNFIEVNKNIFAFRNGYLDITELFKLKFTNYDDMDISKIPTTTVFHNHKFDEKWLDMYKDGSIDKLPTPRFDKLLCYQFENDAPDNYEEIYRIFLGMVGRLHYPIHKYDKLNCMLYIKGGSNTGKSTSGNIIMNNHQNIGTISSKMEDIFGLESFIENKNEIIYCSDLPQNFHKKLDKGDYQKMIEGSFLSISRKGKVAINNYPWSAPLLFIGNYFPGYNDSSGAIPRRMCVFYMNKPIMDRDNTFEEECIKNESHYILLKSLYYYKKLIDPKIGFGGKTFEDWNMEYFRAGFSELMTSCNYLYNFLTLAPGDYYYWPVFEEGNELPLKGKDGFKTKYEQYLKDEKAKNRKWTSDPTTLGRRGFKLITKKLCSNCATVYDKNKKEPCCNKFNLSDLRSKEYILNMRICNRNDIDLSDNEEDE